MPIVNTDPNRNVQPSVDPMDVLVRISGLEKSSLVYQDNEEYPVAKRLGYNDDQEQLVRNAINRLNKDEFVRKSSKQQVEKHQVGKKQVFIKEQMVVLTKKGQAALSTFLLSS